ncbi:hypothetical protein A3I42_04170 [Candidatus Uhrbacteria bacterium RIFCSPLOWO2_02_FULL_49_11]|uniref:Uncharacterized protein n=1 Tax=Candidatus Uhrbacteria bacterium RIFCSPLOWO2_02_FULL_49_11 TaxID=1802409 RepID=A0A1F7VEL3_9BACT|nr:MAG: hypothetical protein A3I42_04170 [Candidatus Uhrbacteria bacterium RIFCSPLOWO2_02_FULL_49_11]
MLLLIISIVVFLAAVGGLVLLVVRKFPVLSLLNVHDVKEEAERRVKRTILEQRMHRKLSHTIRASLQKIRPFLLWARQKLGSVKEWARALEARYQQTLEEERQRAVPQMPQSAEELIDEGKKQWERGDGAGAEKTILQAIALNPRSVPAYKALARLYASRREYDHVRELDEFILKLDPHQADVYADLGAALIARGESALALDALEKAVMIEEENPKYLDQLLELAILRKKKSLAKETLVKLQEVNPENEKIPVLVGRVQELPEKEDS